MMQKQLLLAVLLLASFGASARDPGAVYAMSNAVDGNEVVVYERGADGRLDLAGRYPTGGRGGFAGDPTDALGSQYPLILSADGRWLLAVNAGSNDVSLFRVRRDGLQLVDRTASGGDFPVSLALDEDLLYVLNAGGDGNIAGFNLADDGRLVPLPGSVRRLGAGGTNPPVFFRSPAQIGFTPDGHWLLVTLKEANRIDAFAIDDAGLPGAAPVANDSHGSTPFGFVFDRRAHLLVVEPFGLGAVGDPDAGAVSSYQLGADGVLTPISASVENGQTTPCWVVLGARGRFAYITNNGASSISSYRVARDGSLSLLDAVAARVDSRPAELAMTRDGRFLYALNAGTGTIAMFRVERRSAALQPLGVVAGLPADDGAVGMAVR